MRVPTYSPLDYAGALMDALDWRRMLVGLMLAGWTILMLGPFVEAIKSSSDWQELATFETLSFAPRIVAWGIVAAFLILMLARGGASEFCVERRSSFPELLAFAKAKIIPALVSVSLVPLLYAPIAGVVVLGLWLLPSAWGIAILVVVAPIALIAELVFTIWLILLPVYFSAIAVQGGDGYEANARCAHWFSRAPLAYFGTVFAKVIALGLVATPAIVIFAFAPTWLQWLVGVPYLAFAVSYGALTDIVILVKLRHAADGSPYSLFYDPKEAFLERATSMEQAVAFQRTGLTKDEPTHA
ncbi:MAG: hypothetical protein KDB07_02275 [Planctomycetes bacterium]|nr:hypothetical protein [Planctomycetota bacterium]